MRHRLEGALVTNGRTLDFSGGNRLHRRGRRPLLPRKAQLGLGPMQQLGGWRLRQLRNGQRSTYSVLWTAVLGLYRRGMAQGGRGKNRLAVNFIAARACWNGAPHRLGHRPGRNAWRNSVEVPEHVGHGLRGTDDGRHAPYHLTKAFRTCAHRHVFSRNGAVVFDRVSDHASYEYVLVNKGRGNLSFRALSRRRLYGA